jgi:hypothetical protein
MPTSAVFSCRVALEIGRIEAMAKKKASGKRQPDISLSITEVTIVGGRTNYIRVNIDGQEVRIPVSESVCKGESSSTA